MDVTNVACPVCGSETCDDTTHVSPLRGVTLDQLLHTTFPPRRGLLYRGDVAVIREGNLAQLHAPRGVGKTWFSETLAAVAATGIPALGFSAPTPCHVLYVDGEMASEEIQERFALLAAQLGAPATDRLMIVAADWQETFLPRLDTPEGQAALAPFIARATLVFLDNRSCLFDPDGEKDPTAWQPAQDWLLSLRRRGKAVVTVHHSNRLGGSRGHTKAEDPLNVLLKLSRPEGYTADQGVRFLVEWEKSRGIPSGAAVAPFIATKSATGWTIESPETTDDTVIGKSARISSSRMPPTSVRSRPARRPGPLASTNTTA